MTTIAMRRLTERLSRAGTHSTRTSIFAFGIFLMCVYPINSQVTATRDEESTHTLSFVAYTLDPKIAIEPVTGSDKSSLVMNRAKTMQAFIICAPVKKRAGECSSRVMVTDIRSKTTYMITGEPAEIEVMRPVDDLKWETNDLLSYERWANPHFGRRYVLDAKRKTQESAYIVSDVD